MTSTLSPVEEIMNAMVRREITDPGAHLLALLRSRPDSGIIKSPGVFSLGRVPLTVKSSQRTPLATKGPRYDRQTLVNCAQSPLALLMPPGLAEKFEVYPELKRKHSPGTAPGLRLEQLEAELLKPEASARPAAKICTWDPRANNWVWQAPSFVVGH